LTKNGRNATLGKFLRVFLSGGVVILPNAKVVADFNGAVPDVFLQDVVRLILKAYQDSNSEHVLGKVHQKLRKQIRPIFRKEMIDTALEFTAKRHFNVKDQIQGNCVGSHSYTELRINEKIILTASLVNSPNQLPRPSKFRLEAALNNPRIEQLNLFEPNKVVHADFVNKKIQEESFLYGIITHGPSKSIQPEFIKILIPDFTYSFPVATIDILQKHANLISKIDATETTYLTSSYVEEINKPSVRIRSKIEDDIEEEDKAVNQNNDGEVDDT
jgi:hypothetical protein